MNEIIKGDKSPLLTVREVSVNDFVMYWGEKRVGMLVFSMEKKEWFAVDFINDYFYAQAEFLKEKEFKEVIVALMDKGFRLAAFNSMESLFKEASRKIKKVEGCR
jgi:hypothetical protein